MAISGNEGIRRLPQGILAARSLCPAICTVWASLRGAAFDLSYAESASRLRDDQGKIYRIDSAPLSIDIGRRIYRLQGVQGRSGDLSIPLKRPGWSYLLSSSKPALRRIRRTFLGEIDSRSATRETFFPSLVQTLGITISANSSVTC
jgi:hypothetical protein